MTASLPTARVTTPAEMVAVLPLQVGFVPTESLVVLCCYEPRGRMGMSMRLDLPPEELESLLAQEVELRVRHERATRVVLAVYTDEPGERPRAALVEELRTRFEDLVVTEFALVRDGRFWSYLCEDDDCCPAEGTPVEAGLDSSAVQLMKAEQVGRPVLEDRQALVRSISGPVLLAKAMAQQTCQQVLCDLLDDLDDSGDGGGDPVRDSLLRLWQGALAQCVDPRFQLPVEQAVELSMSLHDVQVRDRVIAMTTGEGERLGGLLQQLCRVTPDPWDAPVCAALAWVTYAGGGGALVSIALERALASDPQHRLAGLIASAWQRQLSPKEFALVAQAVSGVRPRTGSRAASSRARRRRPSRG